MHQLLKLEIALIRTLAEKLIPAIPLRLRIAVLQQTSNEEGGTAPAVDEAKTVLEQVTGSDPYRNAVVEELDCGYSNNLQVLLSSSRLTFSK